MPKKVAYTNITPIPRYVPRQLAIDMLHSHGEIIELNPLVLEHHPIKAPRDAPADEFFSVWHEITERIQYIPGAGRLGSGKISFRGVFHDMPWGLQTHIYAPAGVDLRNKWQIKGNQPGEPPEPRELGSAAPPDGLYLREDVEIKCNFTMVPFVKSATKAASKVLVARLIKKAELIDAELLRQMLEGNQQQSMTDGNHLNPSGHSPNPGQTPMSPGMSPSMQFSPNTTNMDGFRRNTMLSNSEVLRKREEALRQSMYSSGSFRAQRSPGVNHPPMMEMMGSVPQQGGPQPPSNGLAIEMPGDMVWNQTPPQGSPNLRPPEHTRASTYSELSGENSQPRSRPSSVTHDNSHTQDNRTVSSGWGGSQTSYSPNPESLRQQQQQQQQQQGSQGGYQYNPRDFVPELPTK